MAQRNTRSQEATAAAIGGVVASAKFEQMIHEAHEAVFGPDAPVLDGNGTPVEVPEGVAVSDEFRAFMAGRVPAPGCPHYISASEKTAGFTTCEHCYRKD